MTRETIEVGSFAVNCSVLSHAGRAFVVDPGADGEEIARAVQKFGEITPDILLTHGHFDHIGAIPFLQEKWPEAKVYVTAADSKMFGHPLNMYPPEYPGIDAPRNIADPKTLAAAGIVAIDTPGHTPGGVCYYFPEEGLLLSGDTLFRESVGRTDLPGGDMRALMKSLAEIVKLPGETLVVPGHGMETTIAHERENNIYIAS